MATQNFSQIGQVMDRYARRVIAATQAVVRHAATEAHIYLVKATPVDTGLARSNWIMSINGPIGFGHFAYVPGHHLGINETGNATGAILQGLRVAASFKVLQHPRGMFVTNNVTYIGALDRGHSHQNSHFFNKAVDVARRAVLGAKIIEFDEATGVATVV